MAANNQIQHCSSCGRPMENSKAIQRSPEIKYCSQLCRRQKLEKKDGELERYICQKLNSLLSSNLCPSQISRDYFGEDWRSHHQRVVQACRRLKLRGEIEILQKKKVVGNLNFKGPIRIQSKKS